MQTVVVGPGRFQPGIKDTNWVTNRKHLAAKMPPDALEGLLQDKEGCLLEGLVTNFFVVSASRRPSGLPVIPPPPPPRRCTVLLRQPDT
jgi:hypothetical protein